MAARRHGGGALPGAPASLMCRAVACLDAVYADDTGKQNVRAVVEAWEAAVGLDTPLTAKELVDKADDLDPFSGANLFPGFSEALATAVAPVPLDAGSLGRWLRDAKGKVIGETQITQGHPLDGYRRWYLRTATR